MKGRKPGMKKIAKGKVITPLIPGDAPSAPDVEEMPPVMGGKARMRLDRPGRRLGGRVGADMAPMSTAAKRCN